MRISVNNQTIEVSGQRPLIEELRSAGIQVPSMCYGPMGAECVEHHPSCMVCMVKDIQTGQMLPSCATFPYEGMQIETDSDEVKELQRLSLELLLSDHRADCEAPCTMVCQRGIDVAGVIRLMDLGRDDEARKLLHNVSCDDCKAPCENACRRNTVDKPVKIRELLNSLKPDAKGSDAFPAEAPQLWKGEGGLVPFNSRMGRFTEFEKHHMNEVYTQPSHCLHCACDGRADCQLRALATRAGIKVSRYGVQSSLPAKERIPVVGRLVYEPAKCIRCGLCVYNTQDGFTFERRGFDMQVVIPEESKKHVSEQVARLCPTGALVLKLLLPLMLLLTGCRSQTDQTSARLPEHPQLLWEYRHDVRTVAAPVAYDGKILLCDKHGEMLGLDEDTGREAFSLSLGADMEASFTIHDSTLYVGQIDGQIRSLSLADGNDLWSYPTEGQITAAPILATINGKERLFVGSYDDYMYTLSPQTGELIHRFPTGYYINGAAAMWHNYALFGGCDAWMRIVDGATGQPSDSLQLDAYIPASPVVVGDNAYVADYRGNVYELTLADGHIASHRKLLEAVDEDGGMLSIPVVTADDVFLLTPDRSLLCLNRKDGHERWHTPLKGDVGESSPVLAGDRLLVCTKTGVVTIHDTRSGAQLWEYETGEQIISRPIVGDSRFYVLTARGTLLCFGQDETQK